MTKKALTDQNFDVRWLGAAIRAQNWHFHRRLLERHGIVLGPADYSRIANAIAQGKSPLVEKKPDGSGVYVVRVPSSGVLIFVAAKPTGELITALTITSRLLSLTHLIRK